MLLLKYICETKPQIRNVRELEGWYLSAAAARATATAAFGACTAMLVDYTAGISLVAYSDDEEPLAGLRRETTSIDDLPAHIVACPL